LVLLQNNACRYLDLAKAYVFGDEALDAKFQNTVLRTMIIRTGTLIDSWSARRFCPTVSVVDYVYLHTEEGAPICTMLVDTWTYFGDPSWLLEGTDVIPPAFAAEIAAKALCWRPGYHVWNNLDRDSYHINED
jgi:hypothetical protein